MADLTDSLLESIESGESPTRAECAEMAKCIRYLRNRIQRSEALLRSANGFVQCPDVVRVTSPDFCGSRQELVAEITAFLGERHDD